METFANIFNFIRPRPISPEQHAVEEEGKDKIIETLARGIADRRLETPALFFLELNRPLSFIYSQATFFFRPFLALLLSPADVESSAQVLADPDAYQRLLDRLAEICATEQS